MNIVWTFPSQLQSGPLFIAAPNQSKPSIILLSFLLCGSSFIKLFSYSKIVKTDRRTKIGEGNHITGSQLTRSTIVGGFILWITISTPSPSNLIICALIRRAENSRRWASQQVHPLKADQDRNLQESLVDRNLVMKWPQLTTDFLIDVLFYFS